MRALTFTIVAFGLSGCGATSDNEVLESVNADEVEAPVKLAERDLIRVCKAGAAFRNGRSTQGINAKVTKEQQVRLVYTRDDGRIFEYDCLVEGNILRFRMIDEAGPGAGPGIWSGNGSTTTFKLNPGSVDLRDAFSDGSSASETIII